MYLRWLVKLIGLAYDQIDQEYYAEHAGGIKNLLSFKSDFPDLISGFFMHFRRFPIRWLGGWVAGCVIGWMAGWLAGWLTAGWLAGQPIRFVQQLTNNKIPATANQQ